MIKISNSKLIIIFTKLLILLVIAKLISVVVWWFLPSHGMELSTKENYQPKYQRVSFMTMIEADVKVKSKQKDSGESITNMLLKGLYGKGKNGFVIVAMKATSKKTTIVEVGEKYEGYKLESISAKSAMFSKNGLDFMLSLDKIKVDGIVTKVQNKDNVSYEESSIVYRDDITYYSKNPKQIWKDISIKEIKDGKKTKGFKVTRIVNGSKFANLGLKKGDLIIKANNIRLQSYKEVLSIYNTLDKLDMIQVVVLRANEEVELVYEIN
ncbi:MAG: hypothetical protein DRG78_22175 [Epsilonproteobacteria bacterium]|nr:MAG: hypothetical protein DRG78_22175 [Campylobacterota bacterium]